MESRIHCTSPNIARREKSITSAIVSRSGTEDNSEQLQMLFRSWSIKGKKEPRLLRWTFFSFEVQFGEIII